MKNSGMTLISAMLTAVIVSTLALVAMSLSSLRWQNQASLRKHTAAAAAAAAAQASCQQFVEGKQINIPFALGETRVVNLPDLDSLATDLGATGTLSQLRLHWFGVPSGPINQDTNFLAEIVVYSGNELVQAIGLTMQGQRVGNDLIVSNCQASVYEGTCVSTAKMVLESAESANFPPAHDGLKKFMRCLARDYDDSRNCSMSKQSALQKLLIFKEALAADDSPIIRGLTYLMIGADPNYGSCKITYASCLTYNSVTHAVPPCPI